MRMYLTTVPDAVLLSVTCGLAPLWIAGRVMWAVTGIGPA